MSISNLFEILYFFITGSLVIAISAALMKKRALSLFAGSAGTLLCITVYFIIIYKAGRPPIFGTFESVITMVMVLTSLSLYNDIFAAKTNPVTRDTSPWIWGASLALICLLGFYPRTLNPDFYMYDDIRVIIFFHFRILASALFLYAALIFCLASYHGLPRYFQTGRNFLLTGAAIFLISEFFGSLWCLNWFGDSWHWSRGFLKASCIFLLAMLASHLPQNGHALNRMRAIMGSLPAVGSLWLLFLH